MGPVLVVSDNFKNQFLSFSMSYVPTTIVIIYMFDVMDSLGNCIYINVGITQVHLIGLLISGFVWCLIGVKSRGS